ncbi:hypothetical protein P5673_004224 [Acropora cervicornis]|uniref:Uncharacterized protein n=1 Tax=Acropora cervicornis TaxID=6130 RepID=A0AAD9VDJ4_ACRCE|nr:hypothetical protein P5673_004224 [Acropora cervicornis]
MDSIFSIIAQHVFSKSYQNANRCPNKSVKGKLVGPRKVERQNVTDLATTYGVEIREFCILKGFNPQGKRGKMSSGHLHHPPPKSLFVAILPEEGWFYHPIIALKLIFSPFDLLTKGQADKDDFRREVGKGRGGMEGKWRQGSGGGEKPEHWCKDIQWNRVEVQIAKYTEKIYGEEDDDLRLLDPKEGHCTQSLPLTSQKLNEEDDGAVAVTVELQLGELTLGLSVLSLISPSCGYDATSLPFGSFCASTGTSVSPFSIA